MQLAEGDQSAASIVEWCLGQFTQASREAIAHPSCSLEAAGEFSDSQLLSHLGSASKAMSGGLA